MQNKHQFFLSCWCPNVRGGGGGSSRLGQNPKFTQKNYWTAPLSTWWKSCTCSKSFGSAIVSSTTTLRVEGAIFDTLSLSEICAHCDASYDSDGDGDTCEKVAIVNR